MTQRTRNSFALWMLWLAAAFAVAIVALDHLIISGDMMRARVVLYIIAGGVPAGLISAALSVRRVHWQIPRNDFQEGIGPLLVGAAFAACIWLASAITH